MCIYNTYVCTYITHSTQPVITHNNTLRGSVHKARKVTWMAHVKVQTDAFCDGAASSDMAGGTWQSITRAQHWKVELPWGGYIKAMEVRLCVSQSCDDCRMHCVMRSGIYCSSHYSHFAMSTPDCALHIATTHIVSIGMVES